MSNEDYNNLTVPELRELADERGVTVSSSATKHEIITALKKGEKGGAHVEAQESEGPVEETFKDPYEGFEDPVTDGSKPIIDQMTPSNVVQVLVFDGSNALTLPEEAGPPVDHIVFVQSGRSQEWLLPDSALRKFGQDKDGQIYYNQHGMGSEFKPVDCVELGT
jgi:hypothetical protein